MLLGSLNLTSCIFKNKADIICAPIKIGVVLSEAEAGQGAEQKLGYELALQEINAAGGVNGCPLELVYRDEGSGTSIETAEVAVMELAGEDIVAVLGASSSATTMRVASISTYFKIPVIATAETSDDITAHNSQWVFRLSAANTSLSDTAFDLLRTQVGTDVYVAIIFEESDYGQSSAISAATSVMDQGMRVVSYQNYSTSLADFSSILGIVEDASPDLVYIISSDPNQGAAILNKLEDYNLDQKIIVGHGSAFEDREFLFNPDNSLAVELENLLLVQSWSSDLPWHGIEKFVYDFGQFKTNGGSTLPVLSNVEAYVSMKLVAEGLAEILQSDEDKWIVEEWDHDQIVDLRDALAKTMRDFTGSTHESVMGPISFDGSGQNQANALVLQVQSGNLITVYPSQYAKAIPELEAGW